MEGIVCACPFAAIGGFHNFTVGIPKEHGQSDALGQHANCVHIRIYSQCPDQIGTRVQQFGIDILPKFMNIFVFNIQQLPIAWPFFPLRPRPF
jgi:hypothetical protein